MNLFSKAKRGKIIVDEIGESFLVLGKDKNTLFLSDLQDNGVLIKIPKEEANKMGVSLEDPMESKESWIQSLLDKYPIEKF